MKENNEEMKGNSVEMKRKGGEIKENEKKQEKRGERKGGEERGQQPILRPPTPFMGWFKGCCAHEPPLDCFRRVVHGYEPPREPF